MAGEPGVSGRSEGADGIAGGAEGAGGSVSRRALIFPTPLAGEGGSPRSGETGEGSLRESISQYGLRRQPLIRRYAPPSPTRGEGRNKPCVRGDDGGVCGL